MIKRISVRDILTYLSCPLKLKLNKEDRALTPSELYILCAKTGITEFFVSIATGVSKSSAINRALKVFSEVWSREIVRAVNDTHDKISFYDGAMMVSKIDSIYNGAEDEVIGVAFPIEFSIYGKIIVEDVIDIVLINHSKFGKVTIRAIGLEDLHPWDNNRYFSFKATVFKLAIQNYLGGSKNKRHYSYECRPLASADKFFTTGFDHPSVVYDIAVKVSHAIEKEIFFPTMSKEVCRACVFKHSCNLSLIKG